MDIDITSEPPLTGEGDVKSRVASDVTLKRILMSLVGTSERNFRDGLLYDRTIEALHDVWGRMDYVHEGVLRQRDFQSARGIDPIWIEILDACDFDRNGNVTPDEFVAGFVVAALDKELSVSISALTQSRVTGLRVLSSFVHILNEQIMDEIAVVRLKMGWR